MTSIRAQFWIIFRGVVDVAAHYTPNATADQIARSLIDQAILTFDKRWPGTHRDELRCTGLEDLNTGRVLHSKDLPQ